MIREHLFHKTNVTDPMFRWRGGEVTRLEGLSDGVFALTLTLLVINNEVPGTFYELWETTLRLPIFLACFAMLMMAWRDHSLFFRRYGIQDLPMTVLNAAYLFLIIFLAFPLKFLATFLFNLIWDRGALRAMFALPDGQEWSFALGQNSTMMLFYGAALIGVFGVHMLMLLWAWRQRERLELDRLERFLTKAAIGTHAITCGIALLSVAIAAVWRNPGLAGLTYFLMPVLHPAYGWWVRSSTERLHESLG